MTLDTEKVSTRSIHLKGITKGYGKTTVVNDVSLDVNLGEFLVILGPSGCGKTTLLRIIAGLEKQAEGQVFFDDFDVSGIPTQKRDIGFLFQQYTLFNHMNVKKNVEFGLVLKGIKKAERDKRVSDLLDMMNLSEMISRRPESLSGGQMQRIALARALVLKPSVLLLDEPFAALDASTRTKMRQDIKRLQRKLGITTVLVTHDQEEAFELGDRIAVMHNGRIEHVGTPQEIYDNPHTPFVAQFIGSVNVLNGIYAKDKLKVGYLLLDIPSKRYRFKEGDSVKVLVRPEDIEIEKVMAKMKEKNQMTTGKILSMFFSGPFVKISISLGRGLTIRALKPKSEITKKKYKEGDDVFVNISKYKVFPETVDVFITAPVTEILKV